MKKRGATAPPKGPRWIVDQIAAAFEASRGGPPPARQRLNRPDVDELVAQTLKEELERLGEEEGDVKDPRDSKD